MSGRRGGVVNEWVGGKCAAVVTMTLRLSLEIAEVQLVCVWSG